MMSRAGKEDLSSLRNWWQHRRKGENKTCVKLFRTTNDMRSIVDEYTRGFFQLAYRFVMSGKAEPPQSLGLSIKKMGESFQNNNRLKNIMISASRSSCTGKKIRPKIPNIKKQVKKSTTAEQAPSWMEVTDDNCNNSATTRPTVFESSNGDLQILLDVTLLDGPRCNKILEIVLKGCQGKASPIQGLEDAVVCGPDSSRILITIDQRKNAARIAVEACRNLSMLGHAAKPIDLQGKNVNAESAMQSFSSGAKSHPFPFFNWQSHCSCPCNSVVWQSECDRHSQANHPLSYEQFQVRQDTIQRRNHQVSPRNVRDVVDDDDDDDHASRRSGIHRFGGQDPTTPRVSMQAPVPPPLPWAHDEPILNSMRETCSEFPQEDATGFLLPPPELTRDSRPLFFPRLEREVPQGSRPPIASSMDFSDDDDDDDSILYNLDVVIGYMGHPWEEALREVAGL